MASFKQSLLIISLISLHLTTTTVTTTTTTADIHDILPEFGLPIGILPDAVESYTLSPTTGEFNVKLTRECYVKFDDQTVYYSKSIKGKLSYGSISDVTGIQAKQLFLWLSVTGMDLDESDNMIEFHVGVLSKKLPADMFQDVPECKSKALVHDQGFDQSI
ncbi:uncharacterized protein At5g01610-like [Rutidosis leptorrhynchoides]|uniref:uncharacterized protein At5g01610-like n=1 Tax=Rutidosis leptorrhynchoides TaxID=125765 RepID=UPI003A999887